MATPIPQNRAHFTLDEIVAATGGKVLAGNVASVRGVVTDSRAVVPGCLFVALRGDRFDAHDFIPQVVAQGASAVLVESGRGDFMDALGDVVTVAVPDTVSALGDLAHHHRNRWSGLLIGITGSAGKTSTKELLAAALDATGARVLRTAGNLNNLIGVPMTLMLLDETADHAVIEMGTNQPGEIARLADIARPEIGVVTLVAAAHTEGLGDVTQVAAEKAALLHALHPEGAAVINGDDGTLKRFSEGHPAQRTAYFGRDAGETVRLVSHSIEVDLKTRCVYALGDSPELIEAHLQLLGEAAAINAAAALAATHMCGRDLSQAVGGLESVAPTEGRMCPTWGRGGVQILDDTYNANPRSVALALDTAVEVTDAIGGRVVAVLGDMKELGERSAKEHVAIGRHAASAGARMLLACGPEMAAAVEPARETGGRLMDVRHVANAEEACDVLQTTLEPDDVVLVKGSRSMAMERVVSSLGNDGGQP